MSLMVISNGISFYYFILNAISHMKGALVRFTITRSPSLHFDIVIEN